MQDAARDEDVGIDNLQTEGSAYIADVRQDESKEDAGHITAGRRHLRQKRSFEEALPASAGFDSVVLSEM